MEKVDVLERTTEKTQTVDMSVEQREHLERMPEYRKLLYSDAIDLEATEKVAPETQPAPEPSVNAQRFADYRAYNFPATKRVLFEGISYKDGELISEAPVDYAPVSAPAVEEKIAPAPAPVAAPAAAPAVSEAFSEEDALPTQRTMAALREASVETELASKTHFFAGISTKAKVALAAIVFAIVVAIVVICINTGIISALDVNIQNLRTEALEQQQIYEELRQQVVDIENFEGPIQDLVNEWAEAHGMIRT